MMKKKKIWPPVGYETYPWQRDSDEFDMLSKTARSRIRSSYEAAVPLQIGDRTIEIDTDLYDYVTQTTLDLVKFDAEQKSSEFELPSLLLRSESAASSQIENLTSSARNIALADVSNRASHNAMLISKNIRAMKESLSSNETLSIKEINRIHGYMLLEETPDESSSLRTEQVWIGGYPYSPHGANFVPPHHSKVENLLKDWLVFVARRDIPTLIKIAISHAQFETIHPYTDGNGRTGRVLMHKILIDDGYTNLGGLPISAGLLRNIDNYMTALNDYHEGNIESIIIEVARASDMALSISRLANQRVDELLARWKNTITERAGSSIHLLPALLVSNPVITVKFIANELGITERAARKVVEAAVSYGIISPFGGFRREKYYQSVELIDLLNEISDSKELFRKR